MQDRHQVAVPDWQDLQAAPLTRKRAQGSPAEKSVRLWGNYMWRRTPTFVCFYRFQQDISSSLYLYQAAKMYILTKSLRVDWDLTVSMLVFTAQQIHHTTP